MATKKTTKAYSPKSRAPKVTVATTNAPVFGTYQTYYQNDTEISKQRARTIVGDKALRAGTAQSGLNMKEHPTMNARVGITSVTNRTRARPKGKK